MFEVLLKHILPSYHTNNYVEMMVDKTSDEIWMEQFRSQLTDLNRRTDAAQKRTDASQKHSVVKINTQHNQLPKHRII